MMTRTPNFVFIIGVLLFSFLAGCGGSGKYTPPDPMKRPDLPASFSLPEFAPNFGSFVKLYYFPQEKITYRIVTANANGMGRDLSGNKIPISFRVPDADQANAIRKGVKVWVDALKGLRTIEELPGDSESADVDFVLRPADEMPGAELDDDDGEFVVGRTQLWYRDKPALGRALIHLRGDLNNRDLEEVARHEAGHGIVGFWGHSDHKGDVMYRRRLRYQRVEGASKWDINSARANYTR